MPDNQHCPACGYELLAVSPSTQRSAFVDALRGLVDSLQREPTEFELRAAAHELTVKADRIAAGRNRGGNDAGSAS